MGMIHFRPDVARGSSYQGVNASGSVEVQVLAEDLVENLWPFHHPHIRAAAAAEDR
jgi:hypothetical protein